MTKNYLTKTLFVGEVYEEKNTIISPLNYPTNQKLNLNNITRHE